MKGFEDIDIDSLTNNVYGLRDNLKGVLDKIATPEVMREMNDEQRIFVEKANKTLNLKGDDNGIISDLEEVINLIRK